MPTVSHRILNLRAALVSYAGGFVLLIKGGSLLAEAVTSRPGRPSPRLAAGAALLAGGLKAKLVFRRNYERNLARIAALELPRLWQFFRPGFFAFLAAMILLGASLSRLAHNHSPLLIGVAALDLALAVGLLSSSFVFWRERALWA